MAPETVLPVPGRARKEAGRRQGCTCKRENEPYLFAYIAICQRKADIYFALYKSSFISNHGINVFRSNYGLARVKYSFNIK